MDRSNHYESAFEAFLQEHRLTYIAVDETRRSQLGPGPVKSLDFIVHGDDGRLLVDIKGRKYPGGSGKRRVWECWSTLEDINGLTRWVELFGQGYQGVLLFAYQLLDEVVVPEDTEDCWTWRDRRYLYRGVPVDQYQQHMRIRSPKWRTVTLPNEVFYRLVRPLQYLLQRHAAPNR